MLAPWIISHFPAHRVYCEPFGGGASVLMRKTPSRTEVYNDLWSEIVNVFRVLRDRASADELKADLKLTPFAREEMEDARQPANDPIERARRTLVRSWLGLSPSEMANASATGFRIAVKDPNRNPHEDWKGWQEKIDMFTERLRFVFVENRPAVDVLRACDAPDALHYVDPPYVFDTRGCHAGKAYAHEMTDEQHRELAAVLHTLCGKVIVSGYHSPLYDELFRDWRRSERATNADGANARTEVLWLNYADESDLFGLMGGWGRGGFNVSPAEKGHNTNSTKVRKTRRKDFRLFLCA